MLYLAVPRCAVFFAVFAAQSLPVRGNASHIRDTCVMPVSLPLAAARARLIVHQRGRDVPLAYHEVTNKRNKRPRSRRQWPRPSLASPCRTECRASAQPSAPHLPLRALLLVLRVPAAK